MRDGSTAKIDDVRARQTRSHKLWISSFKASFGARLIELRVEIAIALGKLFGPISGRLVIHPLQDPFNALESFR